MSSGKKKLHYAWHIALSCALIGFFGVGMYQGSVGIFFQPVADAFGVGRGTVASYTTVQCVAMMVTFVIIGRVLPKVNIRILLSAAVVVLGGTFIVMSRITMFSGFYVAGAITGVAMAICGVMIMSVLINNWFGKRAETVLGIVMACVNLGSAVSSSAGSAIIAEYGWEAGYLSFGIVGLLTLLPVTLFVIYFRPSDIGIKQYGTGEPNMVLTEDNATFGGVTAKRALNSISFYMVILFTMTSLGVACFSSAMPGYALSLGWSPTLSGSAASVILISSMVGMVILGSLNDRLGVLKAASICTVAGVIGLMLLILKTNTLLFITGAVLLGLSSSLSLVEPPIVVKQIFGLKEFSAIYSFATMASALSRAVVVPAFSYLYDVFYTYLPSLILALAVTVAGYFFLLAAVKTGRKLENEKQFSQM